jgi:muramoyltetrapeptide carboxypeptidase LdcA involved in peptidoglycan recycling
MIYPEFIKPGQVLGICAPSAGVGGKSDFFDLSLEVLGASGYEIYETDSVRNFECPSAPAWIRGEEFNSLYADDDIAAVMCASGGDYNIEMLPYIDQELVAAHPKWFAGYSDPTAIELLLTTKLDIATIYGVNAGAWDWRPLHKYQKNSLKLLSGKMITQYSYRKYASHGFVEEAGRYVMDAPVEWLLLKPRDGELMPADHLKVTGRLIGGCIDVIDSMIGTPYEDLRGFADRYSEDGLIWFFDNFALDPMILMYSMLRMKYIGLFDNAKAVVFGRTCFAGDATDIDYLEQLERVFGEMDVPVIWNADIGHTKPSMTLINGAIGQLTCSGGRARLKMFLR